MARTTATGTTLKLPEEAIVNIDMQQSVDAIREKLTNCQPLEALLTIVDSTESLSRQIYGLNQLWLHRSGTQAGQKIRMLLANEPGMLNTKNPVHHLLGEGETTMELVQAVMDHQVREANLDPTQAPQPDGHIAWPTRPPNHWRPARRKR